MDQFNRVKKIVQTLVNCSSTDAEKAASKICKDPEAIKLLALACGATTATTIQGAMATKAALAVSTISGGLALPTIIGPALYTGISGMAAKRFCSAVVNQSMDQIDEVLKNPFRDSLGY